MEKRAAYDFIILLNAAINETQNLVFTYLNDAIEHILCYFDKNLHELIDNADDPDNKIQYSINTNYELLNNFAKIVMQSILYKQKLKDIRQLCLQL
jgi:hypothetical protein